jgi:hypothetical protein
MRTSIFQFFLMIVILFSVGCKKEKKVSLSMYDWETRVLWSEERSRFVKDLHVERLYLKVLETNGVDFIHTAYNGPVADAIQFITVIRLNSGYYDKELAITAIQNAYYIEAISAFEERYKIHFADEIQFDFDYTETNRENYFELLRSMKQQSKKEISITLNLEKLKDKTHAPPVRYCMLMLYDFAAPNSEMATIFDKKQLDEYAPFVETYPLPLHFAIASFSRTIVKRNSSVFTLANTDFEMLKNDAHFLFSGDGKYEVLADFTFHEQYLQRGDVLYTDASAISKVNESITFIKEHSKNKDCQIAFFSLNDDMMKRFSTEALNHSIELLKQ